MAAPKEAATSVLAEALPVKQRHTQALRHALQQIDQENAELQRQYSEQLGMLQGTSDEIASCMATFQQASYRYIDLFRSIYGERETS